MSMRIAIQIVLVCASVLGLQTAYSQGTFLMSNYDPVVGVDAPIFDGGGIPLAGADYLAALYAGPSPNSLQPAVLASGPKPGVPFSSGVDAGYFFTYGDYMVANNVFGGSYAWLQVVAWDARLGATYEDVVNLGIGGYGQSPLFYALSGGGATLPPPPNPLIGLQSFSLLPVIPEPSATLILLVGLPLLFRRFRRPK